MKHLLNIDWYIQNALLITTGFSIFAMTFALTSQYAFGYAPCELCIYQRVPYICAILFGAIGIFAHQPKIGLALTSFAFFINTIIASFHVGVEQKWWEGLTSCGGNLSSAQSLEEMRNAIMNAPVTRCDEIAWQFMGISMAGYNVMLCLALALFALYAFTQQIKS